MQSASSLVKGLPLNTGAGKSNALPAAASWYVSFNALYWQRSFLLIFQLFTGDFVVQIAGFWLQVYSTLKLMPNRK